MVRQAGYPGSEMIPAESALLSLLMMKLLDKERRSHINDFNLDPTLGLFAGLNVPPKKSFATDYSYRTQRDQQERLLSSWIACLAKQLCPLAEAFALDFHAIPYRGDPEALENHYLPLRGKAGTSVLAFFAYEPKSGLLCYENANLTRSQQAFEGMRFVDFWQALSGRDPSWLYFDSKLTTNSELSRLNSREIFFVTIRRRGSAVVKRLESQPASAWRSATLNIPKRRYCHVRYLEEMVRPSGYDGELRQIAVTGLGRAKMTLFLTNNRTETARAILLRYTRRNGVEDGLGSSVNFFHLDCLCSEVRLSVDLDAALTVLAQGCYRWLAHQLHGLSLSKPKWLYRKFVETPGVITAREDHLEIRFDRRSHNPLIREAALDAPPVSIPWANGLPIRFVYS